MLLLESDGFQFSAISMTNGGKKFVGGARRQIEMNNVARPAQVGFVVHLAWRRSF